MIRRPQQRTVRINLKNKPCKNVPIFGLISIPTVFIVLRWRSCHM